MKKIIIINSVRFSVLLLLISLSFAACQKDSDGTPDVKVGDMSSGAIKPGVGSGGELLTLTGTGLGQIRKVVFDRNNVPAEFSSTLNTATNFIFRVPDTAFGGTQNIIFTNSEGRSLKIPFNVIALPTINAAFPTDFVAGTEVKLMGNNLDDASSVIIDGTTEAATIVSKSRKEMVVKMPATNIIRGKLKVTNFSGNRTPDIDFVNISKACTVFSEQLDSGYQNWGWGGTYTTSVEDKVTGNKSLKAAYDEKGEWGGLYLHDNDSIRASDYKYFSFWVKGADVDKNLQFVINWGNQKRVTIPANKWSYFRYELSSDYKDVTWIKEIVFQIVEKGKTLYFDNIMFSK